uniref:Plastocyanin-like domain-containing protein n=1 Tax=Tetradesmus obliquus TaxID=3088 RepID=A0A383V6F7_TETOB|eukprot:jgi/Sobl393_1/13656/SZX60372.1
MGDLKLVLDNDSSKPVPPQPSTSRRRPWLLAGGVGLLLGLLIGGLCIALPISLRNKQQQNAVGLSSSEAGVKQLKGITRTYYLAADSIDWDYAPSGRDLCHNREFTGAAELYTLQGIGTKYKKAVYRQYKDSSFKELKPRGPAEEHMGLLGPALHAEVGDTLQVVLRNNLDFPINIMAGGIANEAAPSVNPGDTYTAKWYVPASAGPPEKGPSTQLWVYRSTVDVVRDTQAGLAGPLIVARPGTLNDEGKPADVDREIYMMLQVFNEANSPFYEANAKPHAKALAELSEEDAAESNMKYTVNGFVFCNIPGMNMTVGDRVRWYVSALGSEDALHTAHWHGITFSHNGHMVDQVVVLASSAYVLDAVTDNPGSWLFHCHLTDHISGGMMALFHIDGKAPVQKLDGRTREYFIAAVPEVWDYVPFGGEMCGGSKVNFSDNAKTFVEAGPERIGSKYVKALYVEYTDATFKTRKRRAPEWEHLGLLGPIVRGTVGDTLLVTFKNMLPGHNVSIHAHGVLYDKGSEGSPYYDGLPVAPADQVSPEQVVTYKWLVPERAGPGPADAGSIMWMYHSHVDEAADPAAGLMGAIIITAPGNANDDATPKDVSREFVLSFAIMNEDVSIMAKQNYAQFLPAATRGNASALEALLADPSFQESNLMHSINGYMYCNLPGLDFVQGQSVRIYFMAFGSSADMHTPNTAESQLFLDGHRKQAVALLPGAMLTTDTTPLVPGKGLLQCHVYDHISAGMSAIYNVKNLGQLVAPPAATVRTYYIAAEPTMWDYAPLGYDGCSGQPWNEQQKIFTQTTNATLGSMYKKGVFREYTDASFSTPKPQPPHHGFLGPMLRAEVGDKLVVHFLNRLLFDASIQVFGGLAPIGNTTAYQVNIAADAPAAPAAAAPAAVSTAGRRLLTQRSAAGSSSSRRLSQISAAAAEAEAVIAQSVDNIYALGKVAPGGSKRYEWFVPDTAGPGSSDGPSVAYSYVSGVDHIKHINAGLVGPLVIYKKGRLADPGVDLEVPLLFNIQNEMQSVYYSDNLALQQNKTKLKIDTAALTFPESNLMHTMNGFVYCNGPTLQLNAGDRVRWMVMGFGSEADMHSPVFDGQAVEFGGQPVYSVGLMPSNTYVVDMTANSTGTWDYYCNVLDHIWAGMKSRMVVS